MDLADVIMEVTSEGRMPFHLFQDADRAKDLLADIRGQRWRISTAQHDLIREVVERLEGYLDLYYTDRGVAEQGVV